MLSLKSNVDPPEYDVTGTLTQLMPLISLVIVMMIMITIIKELKGAFS
jgi:hypothetical protein